MTIVTRFPPSPTGFMHIGTARTALYNWLFARGRGGQMKFRIEDTDRARYSEEHVQAIINGLKWLEMDWDGDIVSQFEGRERHAAVAQELLDQGKAYYCFCTPEELEEMREKAMAEGRPTFYDRRWRFRDPKEGPAGVKPVIRLKAPMEGTSTVHDHVQGDVTVNNEQLDDFILLRSDGTPTYMLAVVVDDHDMGVTHVIRGDDHLNNTFRQNIIYNAMGWKKPDYAHLPLILGPDGSKMSKRHGAASVEEYRDMGYLPEAMRNYLLRLGWSHGDDEIISTEQAKEWFNLEHIVKSPARFDFAKLESVNAHYMKEADDDRLLTLVQPFLKSPMTDTGKQRLKRAMPELKTRNATLIALADEADFFLKSVPLDFTEAATKLLDADGKAMVQEAAARLESLNDFTPEKIEELCRALATDKGAKLGKVMMPLRAALTGRDKSPSLFHAIEILGKEETLARLRAAAG